MALWDYCAICGKRIEVGTPCIGIEEKNTEFIGNSICFDCIIVENIYGAEKTMSIADILDRAEAAEQRCETLEKIVKEYQEELIPGYREREEKAERERDAAVNDLKEEVMGKIWACDYCKKNDPEDFQCKHDDLCGCSEWEWRGEKMYGGR